LRRISSASALCALALASCNAILGIDPPNAIDAMNAADGGAVAVETGTIDANLDAAQSADGDTAPSGLPAYEQSIATSASSQAIVSVSLPASVSAHSTIVAAFTMETADGGVLAPPTVVDDLGNVYVSRVELVQAPALHYVFVADDVKPGKLKLSVQVGAPVSLIELYVHEYSGLAAPSFALGASSAVPCDTKPDCVSTPLMAVPERGLVFAYAVAFSVKAGSGFTARETLNNNITEDRVFSTAGKYAATATKTNGPENVILGAVLRAR
jgi:hypothetical protein